MKKRKNTPKKNYVFPAVSFEAVEEQEDLLAGTNTTASAGNSEGEGNNSGYDMESKANYFTFEDCISSSDETAETTE